MHNSSYFEIMLNYQGDKSYLFVLSVGLIKRTHVTKTFLSTYRLS